MEAMLRLDGVWSAGNNALLRAVVQAGAAADARTGDTIALFLGFRLPNCINLTKDGLHTQIEVFDVEILQFKNNADIPGVSGIYIRKIRLFSEYRIDFFFLTFRRNRLAGQTDHFLETGISENLHPPIGQQLVTKCLAPCREEIQGIRLIVNGADAANLRCADLIHGGKRQHSAEL